MTITGAHDFQTGEQWQSEMAFNESSGFVASGTTTTFPASGTYVCSNWQATQLRCQTVTRIFDYTAQWFLNPGGGTPIGERRWSVYDGWPLATFLSLTNLGPYMKLQVSNFSGGSGTAFVMGCFTNRVLGPFQPPYSSPMIVADNVPVGAGAAVTRIADYLYAGPAVLWTFSSCADYSIDLRCRASDGVLSYVDHSNEIRVPQNAGDSWAVVVPPRLMSVTFTNQTGVSGNFFCTLTPDVFR